MASGSAIRDFTAAMRAACLALMVGKAAVGVRETTGTGGGTQERRFKGREEATFHARFGDTRPLPEMPAHLASGEVARPTATG